MLSKPEIIFLLIYWTLIFTLLFFCNCKKGQFYFTNLFFRKKFYFVEMLSYFDYVSWRITYNSLSETPASYYKDAVLTSEKKEFFIQDMGENALGKFFKKITKGNIIEEEVFFCANENIFVFKKAKFSFWKNTFVPV